MSDNMHSASGEKRFRGDMVIMPYSKSVARVINGELVFNFTEGIPAFEHARQFNLVSSDEIKPFLYLESLDVENLGFVCLDPFIVYPNYSVKIAGRDLSMLQLNDPGEAFVLCFATIAENPQETTINLLAPVIININNCRGRQVIQEGYPVRYNIWHAIENIETSLREK